jgi:hypothetical protein
MALFGAIAIPRVGGNRILIAPHRSLRTAQRNNQFDVLRLSRQFLFRRRDLTFSSACA